MITSGNYYTTLTGNTLGNEKYSSELKSSIEEAGQLCLDNLQSNSYSPIMMMGNIQSGKTRAFIGLMSLCFDNDFDMTIILTKCSTALVQQTVSRMMSEFDCFKSGNATVSEVVAQDILEIDFRGCSFIEDKEAVVKKFLKRYKGKKRIIVVKKQADNVDRLNLFIEAIIKNNYYKRLLIVDDEADITSVGYERNKGQDELSLRRISGSINAMRKTLHSSIEHVLMQVTATPYALYLQPESFTNSNIMPIKLLRTVVLPTGEGYIGGQYYFIDSQDKLSSDYDKAKYLIHIVSQDEMDILNGHRKNSGNNSVIKDKRTVRMSDFLCNQSGKRNFALPSLRSWIFDILVGTAIIQLTPGNEDYYLSAVLHAAITKSLHRNEKELIEEAFEILTDALEYDINDSDFKRFVKKSYEDLIQSVKAYQVLDIPSLKEIRQRIADIDSNGELIGLVTEVDIKEVNSDSDITRLLNAVTGELKLENSLTIFVGGQVLDRGITIPNIISFFYGRDPATMQQDTVMQHCRMFGYRGKELLSVTRFYTTYRLFSNMREITIRDNLLRKRMAYQTSGEVVYLEAGGKIKACSPQKVLASKFYSIMPEKRYLPIGFEVDNRKAKAAWKTIDQIIQNNDGYLSDEKNKYKKGDRAENRYVLISSEDALDILEYAYSVIIPYDDGVCNKLGELESVFLFSLSERMKNGHDDIALIVRRNRKLSKWKKNNTMYQDSPDDGGNEGAIARELRKEVPVLVLTEQTHQDWGCKFWWPVYYTPNSMNVGLYSDGNAKTGVYENNMGAGQVPISISQFSIIDNVGMDTVCLLELKQNIDDIQRFYSEQFEVLGCVTSSKKRKEIECPVYVDTETLFSSYNEAQSGIESIKKDVRKIFEKIENAETAVQDIIIYLNALLEKQASDKLREIAIDGIEQIEIRKNKKQRIYGLLYEAEEIAMYASETLGYFQPLGAGRCEIHLNYGAIADICEKYGVSKKSILSLLQYVMSHEMFHALHYADVMTKSGRWLYKNKDYHKQGAVKETLAEYFALCYAKYNIVPERGEIDVVKYIHKNLDVNNFPKDGGYSGAVILEKEERKSKIEKENLYFNQIYRYSLSDMPKAFAAIPQ